MLGQKQTYITAVYIVLFAFSAMDGIYSAMSAAEF